MQLKSGLRISVQLLWPVVLDFKVLFVSLTLQHTTNSLLCNLTALWLGGEDDTSISHALVMGSRITSVRSY